MSQDSSIVSLCKKLIRACPYLVSSDGPTGGGLWFLSLLALRVLEPDHPRRMPVSWRKILSGPPSLFSFRRAFEGIPLPLPLQRMPEGLTPTILSQVGEALEDPEWVTAWQNLGGHLFGQVYEFLCRQGDSAGRPPGLVYTPIPVARRLTQSALKELCTSPKKSKPPRILDLGMGCGGFLIEVYSSLTGDFGYPRGKVVQNLFGLDVDPQATRVARLALACECLGRGKTAIPPELFTNSLQCGDVSGSSSNLLTANYDLVIGNPPWVSLKGKFRKTVYTQDHLDELTTRLGIDTYRPNLAEVFIRIGHRLLRENGILGMVLPDRIAHNLQFEGLRTDLLRSSELLDIVFGIKIHNVTSENMTLLARKRVPRSNHRIRFQFQSKDVDVTQEELEKIPRHVWKPQTPPGRPTDWQVSSVPLSSLARTAVGFIPRPNMLTSKPDGPNSIPVLRGRNVVRYGTRGRFFFSFLPENLVGGTQDPTKLGRKEKILIRKTGTPLIATLDRQGIFPEQSLYFLYSPKPGISMRVLLAWLNSDLLSQFVSRELLTNPTTISQIKKVHLDRIPVPMVLLAGENIKEWRKKVESLVAQRLKVGKSGSSSGTAQRLGAEIENLLLDRLGTGEDT